jgi:hypothetical protein
MTFRICLKKRGGRKLTDYPGFRVEGPVFARVL